MKYKRLQVVAASLVAGLSLLALSALPVSAQTATSTTGNAARLSRLIGLADKAIEQRIASLNALSTRLQSLQKISDSNKSDLSTMIQSSLTDMNALKAKIDSDTDLATLRTDVKSITGSYRIYVLVVPRGYIFAAADRIMYIGDLMNALAGKLQGRIASAQSAGKDVSSLQSALTDLNAKVSDANAQAQAAVSEVASLAPDQGDQTKLAANDQALKDARSKIKTANADLIAARKDAAAIAKGLRAFGPIGTPPAQSSTPGQ
ncbi:MAG TPA: hypothetical protein VMC43_00140 [Candidatus Paceibacterota bacterium]|nr:hypothetical protein [Candidatus Paceibacterota bacterium]